MYTELIIRYKPLPVHSQGDHHPQRQAGVILKMYAQSQTSSISSVNSLPVLASALDDTHRFLGHHVDLVYHLDFLSFFASSRSSASFSRLC